MNAEVGQELNLEQSLRSGAVLEGVLFALHEGLSKCKFVVTTADSETKLLLFLSATENAFAFLRVLVSPHSFASVANARSALEALIDMRAVHEDKTHIARMSMEFYKNKRNAFASTVRMLQKIGVVKGIGPDVYQRKLNDLDKEISQIKIKGTAKKRKDELIADHIDDSGILLTLWTVLCDITHNNLNVLSVRHISKSDGQIKIMINAPIEDTLAEGIVGCLASMFVDSAITLIPVVKDVDQDFFINCVIAAKAKLWWLESIPTP